ncbi:MAG TPA: antibiotic biosynthesis monooxygenase [Tahibacter sp.]|nr:antibiotic biosynthesis monooxygenase [Tahibacter sp.]
MVLTVFRTKLNPGVDAEAEAIGTRLYALATSMPGFVSYREFQGADGESVALVEFASAQELAAWRNHPEHLDAQRIGRERLFSEYRVQVCTVDRDYAFPA